MENEYHMPTQKFRFEITFEYEVEAYNVVQAYKTLNNINIDTSSQSSTVFNIGRRTIRDIELAKKYNGRDFYIRPDYFSNATGSCEVNKNIVIPKNRNHRGLHKSIKYLGAREKNNA